jgi:Putative papain-like cysteine peptidase (DUF1796)
MNIPLYDNIVSLGGACETAYHIRRHFGIKHAQVFDWWVTPTDSLISILSNNFQGLFEPERMIVRDNGNTVECSHYSILHHHDFDRDEHGLVVSKSIPDLCARNQQKYGALANRFRGIRGRVLFVRYGDGCDPRYHKPQVCTVHVAKCLANILQNTLPDAAVDLLLLNSGLAPENFLLPNLTIDSVVGYGQSEWYGSAIGWDKVFDRHGVHYNGNLTLGE